MRIRAALLLALLLFPALAFADGKYWPEPAYPKDPAIPLQRAMIVFDNDVETLIVESSFDTDSPNVGWVLPVPAEPTKLAVADAGMCRSLAMSLRPAVVHDLAIPRGRFVWGLLALIPAAAVLISQRDMQRRMKGLAAIALVYLVIGIVFVPMLSTAGARLGGGAVTIVGGGRRVGNYTVDVLRAKDASALDAWLKSQDLRGLDAAERPVVDDYIARKWCFVVARLQRDAKGEATPHPIAVSFPAEHPVYPMKLTALAGSRTRVELFVVADDMAKADGFEVIAADHYRRARKQRVFATAPYWEAAQTPLVIGSPDAGAFLWEGCVVTRLAADLSPAQMKQDVTLTMEPLQVHRQTVYSERGRNGTVQIVLLLGGIVLVLASTVLFCGRSRPSRWKFAVLGLVAALAAAGAVGTRLSIHAAPVRAGKELGYFGMLGRLQTLLVVTTQMLADGKLSADMTDEQLSRFPDLYAGYVKDGYDLNPLSDAPMRMERTPGNFSVRRCDNTTFLCFYDLDGCECRIDLKPPATDAQSGAASSSSSSR